MLLLVTFGSLKIWIEIGVLFHFDNFRAMVVQLCFKKSKFGEFKSSPKLLSIKLVHLIRNMH